MPSRGRRLAACFAALVSVALLFLVANRGAYEGYFHGDDFDNLSLVAFSPLGDLFLNVLVLRVGELNERAVGFLTYAALWKLAGLQFPFYVAPIQALHGVTAGMLWLWMRKLEIPLWPAIAATLFWAFHAAALEVWWRPMFLFDLLYTLFGLLCLLAYTHRAYVLSFVLFWLAFRAKEPALMLAGVLFCYEFLYGEKRWRRVAPFLLVALAAGVQALVVGAAGATGEYRRAANLADLWRTVGFYSSGILLLPYAGLALPLVLWWWRDRRILLGLALFASLLFPMLLLPERLQGAYLYGPLTGMAVILATLGSRLGRYQVPLILALLLAWAPWNHSALRTTRRTILATGDDTRAFVASLASLARAYPAVRNFVFDAAPPQLSSWGVKGALSLLLNHPVDFHWAHHDVTPLLAEKPVVLVSWAPGETTLSVTARLDGDLPHSYIQMTRLTPIWQLTEGWLGLDRLYRWTRPRARAQLWRPPNARLFALRLYAGADLLGRCGIQVVANGEPLGRWLVVRDGAQTLRLDLPPRPAGIVDVQFDFDEGCRTTTAPDPLGAPVMAFGFPNENQPE